MFKSHYLLKLKFEQQQKSDVSDLIIIGKMESQKVAAIAQILRYVESESLDFAFFHHKT